MRVPRQSSIERRFSARKNRLGSGQFSSRRVNRDSSWYHTTLGCESLELRNLLSATASPEVQVETVNNTNVVGLTASQISTAYGFSSLSAFKTSSGSTVAANGAGQTIAIIDSYNDPNIASDLAKFDTQMGLPAANLTVVNQSGGKTLPATNASWDLEISLDVEWAHAIAPDANILLVEANSDNLTDLLSAVQYATTVSSVSVVSMSWGMSEFNGETSYDSYFTTPAGHQGITFVGASGDSGSPGIWPALSGNVLAAGGTTLNLTTSNTIASQTAWSDSGGGTSLFEAEPSYQAGVQSTGKRTSPDVSYDANPNTGFAVYDSLATGGQSGWFEVGGTSDAAPQWAAIVAIADQGRVADGGSTLNGAQAALYSLPSSDFHEITSGSNGGYSATAGYNEVTGLGTPIANLLIPGLVSYTSGSTSSGSGSSGSSGSGSSGSGSTGGGSSGGGSSGGNHGGGFGGGFGGFHNPFSGFGGFSGFFGFGGRMDDIGSSTTTASVAAVVDAFVTTVLASEDNSAGPAAATSSTALVGIQPTGVLATDNTSSAAAGASAPDTSSTAPSRMIAFGDQNSDFAETNAASDSSSLAESRDLTFNVGATSNTSDLASSRELASSDRVRSDLAATLGDIRAAALNQSVLHAAAGIPAGSLSPAVVDAVWSSVELDFDEPAILVAPAPASAENSSLTLSSPVALVVAGVAIEWAKSQAHDRLGARYPSTLQKRESRREFGD